MATLHISSAPSPGKAPTEMDRRILGYLERTKKDYYDEEIADDPHFQVWYQLSSLRTGLFSWYPFRADARLLEIGAGFGPLTGLLCDRCTQVVATERSAIRASAIAERWKEKENLQIYAGEWSELDLGGPFDYILLTGILERACGGSSDRNLYAAFLKKAAALLKPDGVLFAAVENRMGLRYFCGAKEPHVGRAFEGIAHYPRGTRGYSFTREELKDILDRAGFRQSRFYYPLPDYKLPQLIYTDDHLPAPNLQERLIPYYGEQDPLVLPELDLYRDVVENGVFPFFANSFLVECRCPGSVVGPITVPASEGLVESDPSDVITGEPKTCGPSAVVTEKPQKGGRIPGDMGEVLYAAVSMDRGRERGFATMILKDGRVRKAPLFAEGKASARKACAHIEDLRQHKIPVVPHTLEPDGSLTMPYIPWPTLSNYIKEVIREDQEEFLTLIDRIYGYILQSSECLPVRDAVLDGKAATPSWDTALDGRAASPSRDAVLDKRVSAPSRNALLEKQLALAKDEEEKARWESLDFGPILKKAYMELIPLNCFYQPETGAFLFFDQEFVREDYPAGYVLFRAIHYIYCFTPDAEQYYPRQKLLEKYGLTDTWEIYLAEEQRFLDEVREHARYRQFYQWAQIPPSKIWKNRERLHSEAEIVANYPISDKMKKIWKVELAMLDEVDRICKKHGLTFFLVHGSLLGAIRHKGFIPWDDDLDIAMPRADYDRFIRLAPAELKKGLSVHTPETEEDLFWGAFARIRDSRTTGIEARDLGHKGDLGIWIDVLPLDVCTMDEERFAHKQKKIRHCQRLLYAKIYGREFAQYGDMSPALWRAYILFAHFYSHRRLCQMLDEAVRLYTDGPSEDVAFFSGYYKHRRLLAADFKETVPMEFEHRMLPVPAGYENYMFMSLGKDYLKYPPKEERKPKHRGIFDPGQPFTAYTRLLWDTFEGANGKQIILFGSGMMFEDYMKKYGDKYRPAFLVDNDANKWGRARMGIQIKEPEAILTVPKEKRHLIICSFYYREIGEQLQKMGIDGYKVYVQEPEWILRTEAQREQDR